MTIKAEMQMRIKRSKRYFLKLIQYQDTLILRDPIVRLLLEISR